MEKVIYETQFVAQDGKKEYPHGYGFSPVLVSASKLIDPVVVSEKCRNKLSNDEFLCIGAIAKKIVDFNEL